MKLKIKVEKEVDIKYCLLKVEPRYWEDASVNGFEDTDGNLVPCKEGNIWCPRINIETGEIVNWSKGTTAQIHYKVCDAGSYYLQDEDYNTVLCIEEDYVPNNLIPGEYGDYIIMNVDINGMIKEWSKSPNLTDFYKDNND